MPPFEALFPKMDPELRRILANQKSVKQFAPNRSNIALVRKGFDALTARWHASPIITNALKQCRSERPWSECMITIPTRDGYAMLAKVYRSVSRGGNVGDTMRLPVIILVHGGGCCLGGLDTDEFIAQYLCSKVNALVVNIEYRLCPEFTTSVPIHDVYDAISWIQENAGTKGSGIEDGDVSKGFIGCGVSAGGNLIGAVLWMAAEEKRKMNGRGKTLRLTGVMMLMTGYPFHEHDKAHDVSIDLYPGLCESWTELQGAPIANRETMPDYIEMGQVEDITSPIYSLLNIAPDSPVLADLTDRWYHQLGGLDPWRDSSRLWLSILLHGEVELLNLKANGFAPSLATRPLVKVDDYDGLPHTWWSVFPQVSRTKQWMQDLVDGAKWTLKSETTQGGPVSRDAKL